MISLFTLSAGLLEGGFSVSLPDKDINGTVFLVNRQLEINSEYAPEVRKTNVYGMSQSMREDAAIALEEMFAAAKEDGVNLAAVSGYRSYSRQKTIYARKKVTAGVSVADSLVALPGSSEHQLGLAMDLSQKGSSQLNAKFAGTKAGQWINKNAHRFGFIVRYPEEYEEITGYAYEPWHVRYVGKEHANAILEAGIPMELYISAYRLSVLDYLIHMAASEVLP